MRRVAARLARLQAPYVYLVIALVWGLVFCFLVPPFQQFDEVAHFQRAWAVSSGQVATDEASQVSIPQAVADLPGRLDFVAVGEGTAPYSPSLTWDLFGDGELGPSRSVLCFAGNPLPVGHLPAATGVGLARLVRLSPLAALYAGRVANLLVGVLVVVLRHQDAAVRPAATCSSRYCR